MYEQKKDKKQVTSEDVTQRRHNRGPVFQFVDNRPETIQKKEMQQKMANSRPKNVFQLKRNRVGFYSMCKDIDGIRFNGKLPAIKDDLKKQRL